MVWIFFDCFLLEFGVEGAVGVCNKKNPGKQRLGASVVCMYMKDIFFEVKREKDNKRVRNGTLESCMHIYVALSHLDLP